jgi:hypothetical protein
LLAGRLRQAWPQAGPLLPMHSCRWLHPAMQHQPPTWRLSMTANASGACSSASLWLMFTLMAPLPNRRATSSRLFLREQAGGWKAAVEVGKLLDRW